MKLHNHTLWRGVGGVYSSPLFVPQYNRGNYLLEMIVIKPLLQACGVCSKLCEHLWGRCIPRDLRHNFHCSPQWRIMGWCPQTDWHCASARQIRHPDHIGTKFYEIIVFFVKYNLYWCHKLEPQCIHTWLHYIYPTLVGNNCGYHSTWQIFYCITYIPDIYYAFVYKSWLEISLQTGSS